MKKEAPAGLFDVAPIPTFFGGIYYRSRTEARWAVFLSMLEIPFNYEDSGFAIKTDAEEFWYLPDFLLPDLDAWPQVVEVKGAQPTQEEVTKLLGVCEAKACDGMFLIGRPDLCGELWWFVRLAQEKFEVRRLKQDFLSSLFGDTDRAFLVARSYRFERGHDVARETLVRMFSEAA